jgi:hypothetical protein
MKRVIIELRCSNEVAQQISRMFYSNSYSPNSDSTLVIKGFAGRTQMEARDNLVYHGKMPTKYPTRLRFYRGRARLKWDQDKHSWMWKKDPSSKWAKANPGSHIVVEPNKDVWERWGERIEWEEGVVVEDVYTEEIPVTRQPLGHVREARASMRQRFIPRVWGKCQPTKPSGIIRDTFAIPAEKKAAKKTAKSGSKKVSKKN